MTASILVATPHPAFGELLRSSLEENGKYRVHVSLSSREARASSLHGVFQLAILDFALSDEPFIPLCFDLLDQQKGLRLVVVPPENNPNHPALGGLMPHGYLSRPFYLPDLLETVSRLLDDRAQNPSGPGMNGQVRGKFPAAGAAGLSYTLPGWLVDPHVLTGYLEQQLGQTQALAALVGISDTTPGKGILHASAGKLNQTAAQEMTNVVFRYWNRSKKADLMRFVRLNSEKQDFLIYATPLAGDLVLTLVYDTSSPLSQVRPQTKNVAQALSTVPPEGFTVEEPKVELPAIPVTDAADVPAQTPGENGSQAAESAQPGENSASAAQGTGAEPDQPLNPADPPAARPTPSEPVKSAAQEPETQPLDDPMIFDLPHGETTQESLSEGEPGAFGDDENQVINLSALLGTIPRPDPGTEAPDAFGPQWPGGANTASPSQPAGFNGWQPDNSFNFEPAQESAPSESTLPIPPEMASQNTPVRDWSAHPPADEKFTVSTGNKGPVIKEKPSDTGPLSEDVSSADGTIAYSSPEEAEEPPAESQIVLGNEPAIDPLEDTRPRVLTAISNLNQLEPVSPALSLLNYTCVLVPRLPQHYLTGELADRLSHWVQQLCLAFGWRLEGISVRPEYLQWTLQVAPSVSPGNLVKIIRQRTSNSIFNHFAHLAEQNPSGDFWATGYLIVSGAQPPSAQLLRDYISQTRKRQGIGR